MRLVADVCPGCGANVQVDADADKVQCTYCSATFRLGESRVAKPVMPRPHAAPQPKGSSFALWFVPLVLLVLAVVGAYMRKGSDSAPAADASPAAPQAMSATAEPPPRPSWLPHQQALLVDVNGDGLKDAIGWGRYYQQDGDPQYLIALDGRNGELLWQSERFSPEEWSSIRVALIDQVLVVADTGGLLRAIATRTGKTTWSTPLGEKVRLLCRRTQGGVLAYLDDDRAVEATFATGSLTPRGTVDRSKNDCEALMSLQPGENPQVRVDSPRDILGTDVLIEGLETSLLVLPAEGNQVFALGIRAKGTHVPMVAAFPRPTSFPERGSGYARYAATWMVALAGSDLQAAIEQFSRVAWYSDGRLYAPYTTPGNPGTEHLVALDAATGATVYDVLLEGISGRRCDALSGADGRLYVTHGNGLDVLEASTGKRLLQLSK